MKTIVCALFLGLVALLGSGCIMDEKVIEIVLTGETYADFVENEDGADEAETATIDMAEELRDILNENDLSLSDIEDAFVASVHYGVTSFSQAHDWTISGAISVRRVDLSGGFIVIANYTSQSVQGALGQKIPATLEPAGVDVINTALDDFRAGGNPILGQGATILAHENVRQRLAGPQRDGTPPTAAMLERGLPELTYAEAVTLLVGIEAETRILPKETKPECPFPAALEIVPQTEQGRVNIAVPIDVPFTEVNRLMEAQFVGKTFPDDKSGAFAVTVRRASVAASGDRLLISLRVKATERKSWFGLGTDANVYVWGRPVLDPKTQVLRLTDVKLDVESEGVMGAAVRAAAPYLEAAVAERTVIDLKPFAANARKSIEAAIAEFRAAGDGVRVDAAVAALRVVDIAFDSTTLRIIAEADGAVKVSVTSLPK